MTPRTAPPAPVADAPPARTTSRPAVIVVVTTVAIAWGVALAVIFFLHRGDDVGRLPSAWRSFTVALRDGPVVEVTQALRVVGAVIVALAIVGTWLGIGDWLTRALALGAAGARDHRSRALAVARRLALGAGASSLVWFGLGVVGLYRESTAACLTLLGLAPLAPLCTDLWRARADRSPRAPLTWLERVAIVGAALPVVLAAVAALAPPTAKDALIYHRALPKAFIAAGGLVDVPFNIASFFALGAEMHGTWAFLLGSIVSARVGEMAFGLVEFAFFPVLLLALYGWARENGCPRSAALTATALVAAVPTAYAVATNAYIDLALALFATLAIEAAAEFRVTGERAALARLALFTGFALFVKHTAMFLLVPMPFVILLRARHEEHASDRRAGSTRVLVHGAIALTCAAVIGSGWYVRNWVRTGSPLFPFYMNLWPGHADGWDRERSLLLQSLLSTYGGDDKTWLDYLITPLRLSLLGQPEDPVYYEGVLGITFLFGLPLVVWAAGRRALPSRIGIAAVAAAFLYAQWLVSLQGVRYLLPIVPTLALALVTSGEAIRTRVRASSSAVLGMLLASTLAGQVVIVSWFVEQQPVRVVLGGESRRAFLERRLDYYPYDEYVNERLPANARVWLIDMRRDTYHVERPAFADYLFEDYTITRWVNDARDVEDVRQRAKGAGITHVLVRHDLLLDPARSPIVDERRPDSVNADKMRILRAFFFEGTTVLQRDARFALIAL